MPSPQVYVLHPEGHEGIAAPYVAALRTCGLEPWSSQEQVFPGLDRVEAHERGVAASSGAVVLFTAGWKGDGWMSNLLGALHDRLARDGRFFLPVLAGGEPPETLRHLEHCAADPAQVGKAAARHAGLRRRPAPGGHPSNLAPWGDWPLVGRDGEVREVLAALPGSPVVVLHGPSGTGKTTLARFVAHAAASDYPDGTWFLSVGDDPVAALTELCVTARIAGAPWPGMRSEDRVMLAWSGLGRSLVLADNVPDEDALGPRHDIGWLPPQGALARVLVTSTARQWSRRWRCVRVVPLTDADAGRLVEELAPDLPVGDRGAVVARCEGLPVALCPLAEAAQASRQRGRRGVLDLHTGTSAVEASVHAAWRLLDETAREVAVAASFLATDGVTEVALAAMLEGVEGLPDAMDAVVDRSLLTPLVEERWSAHRLYREALRRLDAERTARLAGAHTVAQRRAAERVTERPTDTAAANLFRSLTPTGTDAEMRGAGVHLHAVGEAWWNLAAFLGALIWCQRAVSEKERGDIHGRVDHASLGGSLHQVGLCLSSLGRFEEARGWYERAVSAKERGDIHGRVDHASLGSSVHCVGYCLSSLGRFEDARGWYERAVSAKERGDIHGRVNHESLGSSVHCVGVCLSSLGRFEEACGWYERAVSETERGDIHGRVNHASLGVSVHQVGYCLSSLGRFEEARGWYERAVSEAERGDIHGRVDPESLGASVHQVGRCLSSLGRFEEARGWYERAVSEGESGDIHGRVNHESLAESLDALGSVK